MSQNIRSLSSKVDDVSLLLSRSNIDLLAIQETFLDDNTDDSFLSVNKYTLHRLDRDRRTCKKTGGGLIVYTHNKYEFEYVNNWSISDKHIEIMWVKLCLKDTRPTYVANVYRPPDGDLAEAIKVMDEQLTNVQSLGLSDIVVLGDLNVDLSTSTNNSRHLKQCLTSNMMTQLIKSPTRITNTSRTLIDHAWVDNADYYVTAGALDMGLSDHHLIYIARRRSKLKQAVSYFMGRSYREFDETLLYRYMCSINWLPLYLLTDVDHAAEYLNCVLLEIFDVHAPVKKIKSKSNQPKWVTGDFLSAIDAREHICNIFTKHPMLENAARRWQAITLVKRMKNQLKRNYISEALSDCKGDSKQIWKIIKGLWPSKQKENRISGIEGHTDELEMANLLNKHFCNIGPELAAKIDSNVESIISFNDPLNSFNLSEVTYDEVLKQCQQLSATKACGVDGVTARLIRACGDAIVEPLTFIINLSIRTCRVPKIWKTARVTPLH